VATDGKLSIKTLPMRLSTKKFVVEETRIRKGYYFTKNSKKSSIGMIILMAAPLFEKNSSIKRTPHWTLENHTHISFDGPNGTMLKWNARQIVNGKKKLREQLILSAIRKRLSLKEN